MRYFNQFRLKSAAFPPDPVLPMGMSMRAVTHPTGNPVNDPNHIEPCCGSAVPGAIRGSRHGHSRGLMMNTHRATPFLFLHFPFPYIFCNLENSRIPFPVGMSPGAQFFRLSQIAGMTIPCVTRGITFESSHAV
jgi:hypothetical protein